MQRILFHAFAVATFLVSALLAAAFVFRPGVEIPFPAQLAFAGLAIATVVSHMFGARYVVAPQA